MALTTLPFMAITLRHFLLASVLMLFHMTSCFGETIKNTLFDKSNLCSDTFAGTKSFHARSKVDCGAMCATRSVCTAYSYLPDSTCKLHEGDMNSDTCSQPVASAEHFKKVPDNPCKNGGTHNFTQGTCICSGGYVGNFCERLMVDCTEARQLGYTGGGAIYQALPTKASTPIQLQCEFSTHHVVLQRWTDNASFNFTMAEYVAGFGVAGDDYWIGLENLHLVTNNAFSYTLGIQFNNVSTNTFYQRYYRGFTVKGAADGYSMTFNLTYLPSPPGKALGDCFTPLKGLSFSTYDVDNDNNATTNCADEYGGGWWYGPNCSQCNVVGKLRKHAFSRVPGSVSELFWFDMDPPDFSPYAVKMFLFR